MAKKLVSKWAPLRIQARPGSLVEKNYYASSALPGGTWASPKAIAPGVDPAPLDDLMFHGGRVVPQMGFQNIYLGSSSDWAVGDIQLIDAAIARAMQDRRLNDVMGQYFPGAQLSCDVKPSVVLADQSVAQLDEPEVQAKVIALFNANTLGQHDVNATVFNLLLPPGAVLNLGAASSSNGLGGYHGSVHTQVSARTVTLYYSANVFSQILANGVENGIVAFDRPWKNVVATLYHELNEFRTDPDVKDAIESQNNDFLGWMSRQGRECGDQPIFAAGNALNLVFREVDPSDGGGKMPVQFMYSNAVHGAEGPIDAPDPASAALRTVGSAAIGVSMPFGAAIDRVISTHLAELRKPGALSVRPGYQAAGGWLTKKPAIVVTVDRKTDHLAPEDRLPETIAGYWVDVREAGPMERLRATNPQLYAAIAANARPEYLPPVFALERELATGQPLAPVELLAAAARQPAKPQIPYAPPRNVPLTAITDTFTITCHASPDAGWTQLKPFLGAVKSRLTVGMYDFTSAHILDALVAGMSDKRALGLVLDHPPADRTLEQTDEESVSTLQAQLKSRLSFAWALDGKDPKAAAWVFQFAYHIKVAVRDGVAFWLSSGNWNRSNQPEIDPLTDPAGAEPALKSSDRDWHVIVDHPGLAAVFEAYLQNDLSVAAAHQSPAAAVPAAMESLAALAVPDQAVISRVAKQFFAPKTITAKMKIQPVLTPDNYGQVILDLINSATKTLYMQIPYITPNNTTDDVLHALIAAIAKKIRAGLDVRIILSSFANLAALETLQSLGIDTALVHIQNNLHNKGIIVDSSVVAIGSQNWSPSGVTTNRDATLVIFNAPAAQYWEQIFLHDWVSMSTQQAGN